MMQPRTRVTPTPPVAPKAAATFRCLVWKSLGIACTMYSCHHISFFAERYCAAEEGSVCPVHAFMSGHSMEFSSSREFFELRTQPKGALWNKLSGRCHPSITLVGQKHVANHGGNAAGDIASKTCIN